MGFAPSVTPDFQFEPGQPDQPIARLDLQQHYIALVRFHAAARMRSIQ